MLDFYSIGEMLIDFIPGNEPASYIRNAGGAPANAAIAVARNGLNAGVCCCLGDDDFGRFLKATLEENNARVIRPELLKEAVTTMAFVTLDDDGDRHFTFARKPGADMFLSEADVKEEDIAESVIIHAGSCSLSASPCDKATVRAMRLGHEMGKMVSFDVNYRNVMWDTIDDCTAYCLKVLPYVDLLKISEEEVGMMGGEENLFKVMEEYGITLIVQTLGAAGARAYFKGKTFDVPGRKAKCVDATGAGDAFWGGFVSSLRIQGVEKVEQLTEDIIRTALTYGNVSGWVTVQTKGGIPSLPTRAEIEKHL